MMTHLKDHQLVGSALNPLSPTHFISLNHRSFFLPPILERRKASLTDFNAQLLLLMMFFLLLCCVCLPACLSFSFLLCLFFSFLFVVRLIFFGVSEFGRCFINFSSTHTTPPTTWKRKRRSEAFFKWLEFPFWIFYTSSCFMQQQQRQLTEWALIVKAFCECMRKRHSSNSFLSVHIFPHLRFFNRTRSSSSTTKWNVEEGKRRRREEKKKTRNEMWKGMDRFRCVCFHHFSNIIWSNCTPSLFPIFLSLSLIFSVSGRFKSTSFLVVLNVDDEGKQIIINEEKHNVVRGKKLLAK